MKFFLIVYNFKYYIIPFLTGRCEYYDTKLKSRRDSPGSS